MSSKLITIPADLLSRDLDSEAERLLSKEELKKFHERTHAARETWIQRQANYQHLSSSALFPRKHPWRDIEAKAAAHLLEYKAHLWAVLMSLRVGPHRAVKD